MINKKPQQQIISAKIIAEQNVVKKMDLKQVFSPNRKASVINSKLNTFNKTPSNSQNLKSQFEKQPINSNTLSRNNNKTNTFNQNQLQHNVRSIKKITSSILKTQNLTKFSKTSKIPILQSSTVKTVSQKVNKIQESEKSLQKSQQNQDTLSEITIKTLKEEICTLQTLNQELKKENEKLSKKLQKMKSLNDDNKKMLKQKIQNFNSEGENLRKLKQQIDDLTMNIESLKQKITSLQEQNKLLKINAQKLTLSKEQKQIQTLFAEIEKDNIEIQNLGLLQKNYYSSSSRQSFGGILPVETVYNLNQSIKKNNFRTAESTPKKENLEKEKLFNKYDNYWSVKLGKYEETQNSDQFSFSYQKHLEIKSECPDSKKQQQKFILPSNNIVKKDFGIIRDINDFSPTFLVEKYQQISQQQDLIDSLYKIIEEFSREIQIAEKNNALIEKINENFSVKIKKLTEQNQFLKEKIEELMNTSLQKNFQINMGTHIMETFNNEFIDETLLLDETNEQKIIVRETQQVFFSDDRKKKQKKQIRSAMQRSKLDEFEIIDEISKFFNSDAPCRYSRNQNQNVNNKEQQKQPKKFIEKQGFKIDDSLEALQYFSTHTPINLSSEVSCFQFNLNEQTANDHIYPIEKTVQINSTELKINDYDQLHDSRTNLNSLSIL